MIYLIKVEKTNYISEHFTYLLILILYQIMLLFTYNNEHKKIIFIKSTFFKKKKLFVSILKSGIQTYFVEGI